MMMERNKPWKSTEKDFECVYMSYPHFMLNVSLKLDEHIDKELNKITSTAIMATKYIRISKFICTSKMISGLVVARLDLHVY